MKVQSYINMDFMPDDEEPVFDVVLSTDDCSFSIHQMYEKELRELIKEIEDQLELNLKVFDGSRQTVIEDENSN